MTIPFNMLCATVSVQRDPYEPYEAVAKKPKPQVPESSSYGLIFMLAILVIMWIRKKK